jgi:hypothetical protein
MVNRHLSGIGNSAEGNLAAAVAGGILQREAGTYQGIQQGLWTIAQDWHHVLRTGESRTPAGVVR